MATYRTCICILDLSQLEAVVCGLSFMITTNRTGTMKVTIISIMCFVFSSLSAQQLTARQQAEMADCAVHGGGGWVEPSLFSNGNISFSYLLRPSEAKGTQDLYVAFWNGPRSEGRLLVFN